MTAATVFFLCALSISVAWCNCIFASCTVPSGHKSHRVETWPLERFYEQKCRIYFCVRCLATYFADVCIYKLKLELTLVIWSFVRFALFASCLKSKHCTVGAVGDTVSLFSNRKLVAVFRCYQPKYTVKCKFSITCISTISRKFKTNGRTQHNVHMSQWKFVFIYLFIWLTWTSSRCFLYHWCYPATTECLSVALSFIHFVAISSWNEFSFNNKSQSSVWPD